MITDNNQLWWRAGSWPTIPSPWMNIPTVWRSLVIGIGCEQPRLQGIDPQPLRKQLPTELNRSTSQTSTQRYSVQILHPRKRLEPLQTNGLVRCRCSEVDWLWKVLGWVPLPCFLARSNSRSINYHILPQLPMISRRNSSHCDCTSMLPVHHHFASASKFCFTATSWYLLKSTCIPRCSKFV